MSQGNWPSAGGSDSSALVAGSALIGKVGLDQTTPYSTNAVGVPDLVASGSIAADDQQVTLSGLNGCGVVSFQVSGTFSVSLTIEGTVDGTNWFVLTGTDSSTSIALNTLNTSFRNASAYCGGLTAVRVNSSSYVSGTASVTIRASTASTIAGNAYAQGVGLNKIAGGVTVVAGNGTTGSGSLRVTMGSDSTGQVAAIGKAAAGATISGAPVLLGAAARTANPTAVATGQVANLLCDKLGKAVVVSALRELVGIQQTTITSSTTETTIVTAIASTFLDLTSLTITNSSATPTLVTLKDATAGTTRAVYAIAANRGITIPFNPPLPQAAVNTAWTLTSSASVDSLYCSATYVKNL